MTKYGIFAKNEDGNFENLTPGHEYDSLTAATLQVELWRGIDMFSGIEFEALPVTEKEEEN